MKTSVPSEFCLIMPPSVHSLLCLFFLYNAFLALSQSSSELYPWRNFLFFSHTWISWLKCFSPRYIKIGVMELCHYGPQKSVALVSEPCMSLRSQTMPARCFDQATVDILFHTLLFMREWFLGTCDMRSVISFPLFPIYSPSITAASSRTFFLHSSTILSLDIMFC